MAKGQTEVIAAIILTVVGLVLGLLVWSWLNTYMASAKMNADFAQRLAFERGREAARLLLTCKDSDTGFNEYLVELVHTVSALRKTFAFTILAMSVNGTEPIDVDVTNNIQDGIESGKVIVYLLKPFDGGFKRDSSAVITVNVDPSKIHFIDVNLIRYTGQLKRIKVFVVKEYLSGINDPTPNALIDILVDPSLLTPDSYLVLVTLVNLGGEWYEVARVLLS